MMLEIDGEFFEDPCEKIRINRTYVAKSIIALAECQALMLLIKPLFPPRFAEGGIVNPNTYKGDIVHVK